MERNCKYAPVIVPTLNRYEHLKRLVESLAQNPEAKDTELVIGLDFPPSEKYKAGWLLIKDYLPRITGFAKVTILEAQENLGALRNLEKLRDYVFNDRGYDRYIVSEDDNEFSPNFLSFINWGLEKYKDDDRVTAVSGYNYPVDMSKYGKGYYFSHYFSAWGCGRMKSKEQYLRDNVYKVSFLKKILLNPIKLFKIFRNVGWRMVLDIYLLYKNKRIYGDCYMTYYQWTDDKYCLFPTVSKVRNWGHDGSGLHSGDSEREASLYHKQEIDTLREFYTEGEVIVKSDKEINKTLKKFFHKNKLPFADRINSFFCK